MKSTTSKNKEFSTKESKYFNLFKFLYEKNQENKNKIISKQNLLRKSINFLDEEKHNESKKPITVQHFINEDKYYGNKNRLQEDYDFVYYNGDFTNTKSNEGKSRGNKSDEFYDFDNKFEKNNNMNSQKTLKIDLNSLKKKADYKRNFINIRNKYNYMLRRKSSNSSMNYDNNISFLYIKDNNNEVLSNKKSNSFIRINKNNNINIYLLPKRIKNKIGNKTLFLNDKKKIFRSSISYKELTKRNEKDAIKSLNSKINQNFIKKQSHFYITNKNINKQFKVKNNFNDMNQINRFRHLKKELIEEKIKINNMMSEFFKNPLFIKYNHREILLDISKQKKL